MKVSINNDSGLMIESQSDAASDNTMLANALLAGYTNVSVIIVDDAAHAALIAARDTPALPEAKSAAIAKTYRDVDDIYAIAIGARAEEYKQAEIDAVLSSAVQVVP